MLTQHRFAVGEKVVVRYPQGITDRREVGRVFADGTFRLAGGMHRFTPLLEVAVRSDDRNIFCEPVTAED